MELSFVGAIGATFIGATQLSQVGAIELSFVGAIGLTDASAIRLRPVGAMGWTDHRIPRPFATARYLLAGGSQLRLRRFSDERSPLPRSAMMSSGSRRNPILRSGTLAV